MCSRYTMHYSFHHFFSNFMGYRSLKNLRTVYFPKLEKIATIQ